MFEFVGGFISKRIPSAVFLFRLLDAFERLISNWFDMFSSQVAFGNWFVVNGFILAGSNTGAGRIGCGCNIATDDMADAEETAGMPGSN